MNVHVAEDHVLIVFKILRQLLEPRQIFCARRTHSYVLVPEIVEHKYVLVRVLRYLVVGVTDYVL